MKENKYFILQAGTVVDLESLVNQWIEYGYLPFGSMVINCDNSRFYQTMLKVHLQERKLGLEKL